MRSSDRDAFCAVSSVKVLLEVLWKWFLFWEVSKKVCSTVQKREKKKCSNFFFLLKITIFNLDQRSSIDQNILEVPFKLKNDTDINVQC